MDAAGGRAAGRDRHADRQDRLEDPGRPTRRANIASWGSNAGTYDIKAELQGFVAKDQPAQVNVGQEVTVNADDGGRRPHRDGDVVANSLVGRYDDVQDRHEHLAGPAVQHADHTCEPGGQRSCNYAPGVNNGSAFGGARPARATR